MELGKLTSSHQGQTKPGIHVSMLYKSAVAGRDEHLLGLRFDFSNRSLKATYSGF